MASSAAAATEAAAAAITADAAGKAEVELWSVDVLAGFIAGVGRAPVWDELAALARTEGNEIDGSTFQTFAGSAADVAELFHFLAPHAKKLSVPVAHTLLRKYKECIRGGGSARGGGGGSGSGSGGSGSGGGGGSGSSWAESWSPRELAERVVPGQWALLREFVVAQGIDGAIFNTYAAGGDVGAVAELLEAYDCCTLGDPSARASAGRDGGVAVAAGAGTKGASAGAGAGGGGGWAFARAVAPGMPTDRAARLKWARPEARTLLGRFQAHLAHWARRRRNPQHTAAATAGTAGDGSGPVTFGWDADWSVDEVAAFVRRVGAAPGWGRVQEVVRTHCIDGPVWSAHAEAGPDSVALLLQEKMGTVGTRPLLNVPYTRTLLRKRREEHQQHQQLQGRGTAKPTAPALPAPPPGARVGRASAIVVRVSGGGHGGGGGDGRHPTPASLPVPSAGGAGAGQQRPGLDGAAAAQAARLARESATTANRACTPAAAAGAGAAAGAAAAVAAAPTAAAADPAAVAPAPAAPPEQLSATTVASTTAARSPRPRPPQTADSSNTAATRRVAADSVRGASTATAQPAVASASRFAPPPTRYRLAVRRRGGGFPSGSSDSSGSGSDSGSEGDSEDFEKLLAPSPRGGDRCGSGATAAAAAAAATASSGAAAGVARDGSDGNSGISGSSASAGGGMARPSSSDSDSGAWDSDDERGGAPAAPVALTGTLTFEHRAGQWVWAGTWESDGGKRLPFRFQKALTARHGAMQDAAQMHAAIKQFASGRYAGHFFVGRHPRQKKVLERGVNLTFSDARTAAAAAEAAGPVTAAEVAGAAAGGGGGGGSGGGSGRGSLSAAGEEASTALRSLKLTGEGRNSIGAWEIRGSVRFREGRDVAAAVVAKKRYIPLEPNVPTGSMHTHTRADLLARQRALDEQYLNGHHEVYWDADEAWFPGRFVRSGIDVRKVWQNPETLRFHRGCAYVRIDYDDGDQRHTKLIPERERIRPVAAPRKRKAGAGAAGGRVAANGGPGTAARSSGLGQGRVRRGRLVDDHLPKSAKLPVDDGDGSRSESDGGDSPGGVPSDLFELGRAAAWHLQAGNPPPGGRAGDGSSGHGGGSGGGGSGGGGRRGPHRPHTHRRGRDEGGHSEAGRVDI